MLFGETFTIEGHPQAPHIPYSSEGQRAFVYQLSSVTTREPYALKIWKRRFRDPRLEPGARQLSRLAAMPGMRAAERRVVLPSEPAVRDVPDLELAMLMPWLLGKTWYDLLIAAKEGARFEEIVAVHMCTRFLFVMAGLERAGIAHTDISPGNVMLDIRKLDVELLDLEDLYLSNAALPAHVTSGSKGYRHADCPGDQGTWRREGDRYSAAVLAAEVLVLANEGLARLSTDEGFFGGHFQTATGRERYGQAQPWLRRIAPEFAPVFARSWTAESLEACPSLFELYAAILPAARRVAGQPLPAEPLVNGRPLSAAASPKPAAVAQGAGAARAGGQSCVSLCLIAAVAVGLGLIFGGSDHG
ncbi:MAG: hypothetical protein M3O15_02525, partial [Acidobacteriota bacterium]|nr:hypothetical protein [Acidobacteriota bacterium]